MSDVSSAVARQFRSTWCLLASNWRDLGAGAAETPTWCPFLLEHEVLASLVEKNVGNVFSFASVKRNFCAKQGTKVDLTLGLGLHGDGVAHQKCWAPTAPNASCSGGGEGRVVSCGTVAAPLSSTEATLTPTEACVGNATCHLGTGMLLRVPTWRQLHRGCHCRLFCWCIRVLSGEVVAIGAARAGAVAGHRQSAGCSWSQEGGFGVPRVAAPRATGLGTKPSTPSKEICWRCNANCSEILWIGRTQDVVNFLYVCLHFCACVCSSVLRVHVQLCVVSPASPGLFRAQLRSGQIAELWKRIKLRYKTFHTLTWEVIRVDQTPPKLRAKGAETRHMVGALRLRTGDGFPQAPPVSSQPDSPWTLRAAARLLHDHGFGAVQQCCVHQVLSPVLQPPQGFVKRRPPTTTCGS